jgi:Zn-dependent peptidase ImmA (M78 family)/transcriptional regulator with XRE-family HTH domain
MPRVNPDILRWARETAGLSLADAASKLRIKEARGVSPIDRLRDIESGETLPTRPLLLKMAKQYRRPLLTFYLSAPPLRGDRGEDFRVLPEDHSESEEALLDALIRSVRARQSLVKAAIEDEDEAVPLGFVGSADMTMGVSEVLDSIRRNLPLSLNEYRSAKTQDDAFDLLRSAAEELGVFVLLLGNLGSHHTNIGLEAFRGFALADPIAPFVVINDQDSRAAWSFTLLHELTHIWLGQTGVSGGEPHQGVERFCNDVAAAFLLPANELNQLDLPDPNDIEDIAERIGEFAFERKVSRSMVAYNLLRRRRIAFPVWNRLQEHFRERWFDEVERRRAQGRERTGGPDFYVVRRHRLGSALLELTARLLAGGTLTTSKAGQVLGVKPKQVESLIRDVVPFPNAS